MNKKLMSTVTVAGLATLGGMADASADTKYTIENGDTLSHIALEYATTVSQIAAENNIENPDLIFAGDTLWINGVQVNPAVATAHVAPQASVVAPAVVVDTPTTETVEVENPAAKPVAPKVVEAEKPAAKPVAPKAVEIEKPAAKPVAPKVVEAEKPAAKPIAPKVVEAEKPAAKPVAPKVFEAEKPVQPVVEEVTEVEAPVAESVAPKAVEAENPAQPVVEEVAEVEAPVVEAPIAEVVEEVEAQPVAPKPLKQVQPQVQHQSAPVVPTTPAPIQPEVNVNLSVYERFLNAGGTDSLWNVIVMPESGGNPEIVSPSGYRGLGQTKEAWGMGTVEEQTAGMLNYAEQRYGSVAGAVAFRLANGWW